MCGKSLSSRAVASYKDANRTHGLVEFQAPVARGSPTGVVRCQSVELEPEFNLIQFKEEER